MATRDSKERNFNPLVPQIPFKLQLQIESEWDKSLLIVDLKAESRNKKLVAIGLKKLGRSEDEDFLMKAKRMKRNQ